MRTCFTPFVIQTNPLLHLPTQTEHPSHTCKHSRIAGSYGVLPLLNDLLNTLLKRSPGRHQMGGSVAGSIPVHQQLAL